MIMRHANKHAALRADNFRLTLFCGSFLNVHFKLVVDVVDLPVPGDCQQYYKNGYKTSQDYFTCNVPLY